MGFGVGFLLSSHLLIWLQQISETKLIYTHTNF